MELIFDRTQADVLRGTEKGSYGPRDLNRVEGAVEQLQRQAQLLDVQLGLVTKTDWAQTDKFSPQSWPTRSQMQRYLDNVTRLCNACGVSAPLPKTMERLDWQGANKIEEALYRTERQIENIIQTYRYSGEAFAGEENIL